jgi:hypothetical protein
MRKRPPHVDAQAFYARVAQALCLRTHFFTDSDGRGSDGGNRTPTVREWVPFRGLVPFHV